MIQKIAFTPQINAAQNAETPEINFTGSEINEEKKDNSNLLYGSLAALGALGLGLVIRKPKVIEKEVTRIVERAASETHKAAAEVTEPVKKAVKSNAKKIRKAAKKANEENNISGRQKMRTDIKSQRKNEKQLIDRQIQREANESFTEQELQAYIKENGYQKPTAKQQKDIDNLNRQNKIQRQQTNTIGNLAKKPEAKIVKPVVENPELKNIESSITNLRARIDGAKKANKMGRKNDDMIQKLETQLKNLENKRDAILNNKAQAA